MTDSNSAETCWLWPGGAQVVEPESLRTRPPRLSLARRVALKRLRRRSRSRVNLVDVFVVNGPSFQEPQELVGMLHVDMLRRHRRRLLSPARDRLDSISGLLPVVTSECEASFEDGAPELSFLCNSSLMKCYQAGRYAGEQGARHADDCDQEGGVHGGVFPWWFRPPGLRPERAQSAWLRVRRWLASAFANSGWR